MVIRRSPTVYKAMWVGLNYLGGRERAVDTDVVTVYG
jgi:hypothetical protein